MKKTVSAVLIVLVLAGMITTVASAQFTKNTSFQIQNLSSTDANVHIVFYDDTGTEVTAATVDDVIPGNSSTLYVQSINSDLPEPFNGSVVVSSDQPVAAIGIQEAKNASNQLYQGTYSGFSADQAADTFYIPTIMKAFYGYTTEISVQNASSTNVNVTINYKGGYTDSATGVKPGQVVRFNNADTSSMPNNYIGSATITATGGEVVAVVNQDNEASLQQQTYEGFSTTASGPTLYAPVLMRGFYGFDTSVQVQNVGSGSTSVTIHYSNGASDTQTVAAGEGYLFTQGNEGDLPTNWIGSAYLTSTAENIVAVVNQQNTTTGKAASYNAFAGGATSYVGPNVMKDFYEFNTSVQVQNISATATTCRATFSPGATYQDSPTLAQYETYLFTQGNNAALSDGWIGSVELACGGQTFVAIVNQDGASGMGDNAMAYNALAGE